MGRTTCDTCDATCPVRGRKKKKTLLLRVPHAHHRPRRMLFLRNFEGRKKTYRTQPPPSPPSSLRSPLRNLGWRPETECVAGSLGVGYVVQGRPVLDGCNVMCDATQGGSVAVPGIGIRISRPSSRSLVGVVRGCKGVRFA